MDGADTARDVPGNLKTMEELLGWIDEFHAVKATTTRFVIHGRYKSMGRYKLESSRNQTDSRSRVRLETDFTDGA